MPSLFTPPGQNYACTQCGRSCTMFREIRVEPRSAERLLALDYRPLMADGTRDLSPLVPAPGDPDRQVLRRHCGTCVFQRADGLCGVHAAHGYESKPQTCRDFPFRYVETGDGIYVGLSFACTAVLRNEGPPVDGQRGDLEAAFPLSNARKVALGAIALTHRHEISPAAHQALESDLAALLDAPGRPMSLRLAAQAVYIDLYERFLREVRGDAPGSAANPRACFESGRFPADAGPSADVDVLGALRRRFLEDGEVWRLAGRLRGRAMMQRAVLGLLIGLRASVHDHAARPSRPAALAGIVRHYTTAALRLGRLRLEPLPRPVSWGDLGRARFDPSDPDLAPLVERYIRHVLFRKDLLLSDNLWLGQRFLLVHWGLLGWYARGWASIGGRASASPGDLEEAIRAVELHWRFHTRFDDLLDRIPPLATLLDTVLRKPGFLGAMVR